MSRPSPTSTATTAMPSTSAKELKDSPAANQNVPALHREALAERAQLVHRVARLGGDVERLDQRVVAELREVGGDDELAVDAEAAADAGEEERRRAADRADDRADGEERDELLAVVVALAVAAVDRDAVDAEAGRAACRGTRRPRRTSA